jgi:hypothetical protein
MRRTLPALPFAATALAAAACNLVVPGIGLSPSPGPSTTPSASASPTAGRTPDPRIADVCGDIANSDIPVTAGAATGSAPALDTKHKKNRIALVAHGSGKGGFVKFSSDKEGPWDLYLTRSVPITITTAAGTTLTPSASQSTFFDCAALAARYTVGLKLGVHYLEFGPTSESEVSVVTENGEEEE